MTRTLALSLLLCSTAAAQAPLPAEAPLRFRSEWDIHGALLRIRPEGDTTAAWSSATARRFNSDVFQAADTRGVPILLPVATHWSIEAAVPEREIRHERGFKGAAIGGVIGAAAVVAAAATCKNDQAGGPGCGMALIFVLPGAGAGMIAGRLIAQAFPVKRWHAMQVVK
jgi:hypothetical protein